MKRRKCVYYSQAQKDEMWDRWRQGESLHEIARSFNRYHSSVQGVHRQSIRTHTGLMLRDSSAHLVG